MGRGGERGAGEEEGEEGEEMMVVVDREGEG